MTNIVFNIARICQSQFKCNYLKIEKMFHNFLFHFSNLHQIFNISEEKMIVIAGLFTKLQTVKSLFRTLYKRHRFGACFDSQHLKASQILAKSPWERFYLVFSSFSGNLNWKISPLVLREILGIFVNTLTVDGKYPVQDCKNLQLSIQMKLSQKRTALSQFFL